MSARGNASHGTSAAADPKRGVVSGGTTVECAGVSEFPDLLEEQRNALPQELDPVLRPEQRVSRQAGLAKHRRGFTAGRQAHETTTRDAAVVKGLCIRGPHLRPRSMAVVIEPPDRGAAPAPELSRVRKDPRR